MNVADIQRLFDYTEWANNLALDAAGKLSEENLRHDCGISHKSIFGTLVHMAGAEWIWWERWNGHSPKKDEAWSIWSIESCATVARLRGAWGDLSKARTHFLAALDDEQLQAEIAFRLLNGDPNSMRLVDQMQHVVNHATMHRGQIVGMIRQLGFEPPATDLLFYLRREVSPR